jgi:hypothetical protein
MLPNLVLKWKMREDYVYGEIVHSLVLGRLEDEDRQNFTGEAEDDKSTKG